VFLSVQNNGNLNFEAGYLNTTELTPGSFTRLIWRWVRLTRRHLTHCHIKTKISFCSRVSKAHQ